MIFRQCKNPTKRSLCRICRTSSSVVKSQLFHVRLSSPGFHSLCSLLQWGQISLQSCRGQADFLLLPCWYINTNIEHRFTLGHICLYLMHRSLQCVFIRAAGSRSDSVFGQTYFSSGIFYFFTLTYEKQLSNHFFDYDIYFGRLSSLLQISFSPWLWRTGSSASWSWYIHGIESGGGVWRFHCFHIFKCWSLGNMNMFLRRGGMSPLIWGLNNKIITLSSCWTTNRKQMICNVKLWHSSESPSLMRLSICCLSEATQEAWEPHSC